MIYFIENKNNGYIKIGHTYRNPNIRLIELKRRSPMDRLILLGCMDGSESLESYLIDIKFFAFQIIADDDDLYNSDWFEPTECLITYIEERCQKYNAKTV